MQHRPRLGKKPGIEVKVKTHGRRNEGPKCPLGDGGYSKKAFPRGRKVIGLKRRIIVGKSAKGVIKDGGREKRAV